MGFIPDITVQERDWYRDRLVVGVDDDNADLAARAEEIKAYMDKSRVPEGLLVSPTHFRVYRNDYKPYPENPVTEVADFPTERVMGRLPSQTKGPEFEDFVQRWLERLQAGFLNGKVALPPDIREIVEWEIMPQLYVGEIGATGPRWSPVAS
jgi:Uma2 family endonuclease